MHFGSTLRFLRVDAGISARELARRIGVSSAYLSRVENGYDAPPTPDRLVAVADALGVSRSAMVELARQAGPAVDAYLVRVPAAGALFLEIAERDLDTVKIARLKAFMDQEFPSTRHRSGTSLAALLPADRVVIGFAGVGLRDLIEVAAARLPERRGIDPAAVAEILFKRETDASSCIGGGIIAPHAVIPGMADAAVLVTMSRPLPIDSPDGEPVRVGVIVVSGGAGPAHLDVLSRVARLASYGVAAELCASTTPRDVRAVILRLETMW